MAKAQSFAEKTLKKKGDQIKVYKVIFPYKAAQSNAYNFSERFIKIPANANEQTFLEQEIKKSRELIEKKRG
jgi:hypothetical protein